VNASTFRNFARTQYQIQHWASTQRDGARERPQISAGTIFEAMVYRPVIGANSLLQLDQKGRFKSFLELVGSSRAMVASDTTMLRALSEWDLRPARAANYAAHLRLRQKGLAKWVLPSGRKVCLAVVDGTNFGGHLMSVMGFAGRIYQAVDLEPSEGRGHELITSRALLMRAAEHLGYGFATHVLYDGLMADRNDFRFVRKALKSHLVVKTSEETLEIIQSSSQVWTQWSESQLKKCGVEIARGVDTKRGVKYEVYAQAGVPWEGLEFLLKLAWVRETHLKGKYKGQTFEFWVMTTDEGLNAEDMREVAHKRWAIENNGFKELNERLGSKDAYLKDSRAKQAGMLMGFLGMTLLKAFAVFLETSDQWRNWTVRKTKRLLGWVIEFGAAGEVARMLAPP
jgi:hypothetical protein